MKANRLIHKRTESNLYVLLVFCCHLLPIDSILYDYIFFFEKSHLIIVSTKIVFSFVGKLI